MAENILNILNDAGINAKDLSDRCTEALGLTDILLAQHKLPISYDWLKTFFHWLSGPFLLSAHADLAAQRDAPPFLWP